MLIRPNALNAHIDEMLAEEPLAPTSYKNAVEKAFMKGYIIEGHSVQNGKPNIFRAIRGHRMDWNKMFYTVTDTRIDEAILMPHFKPDTTIDF